MKKTLLIVVLSMALLLAVVPAAWAAPDAADRTVHVVKRGENLNRIAKRYGSTVRAIVKANKIKNPNLIYPGQRLTIPDKKTSSKAKIHIVRRGQSLTDIARKYDVRIRAIQQANEIKNRNLIYPGQKLTIPEGWTPPKTSGVWYTVRKGDTLSRIARRHGVRIGAIARENGLRNPNRIYVGQKLYLP